MLGTLFQCNPPAPAAGKSTIPKEILPKRVSVEDAMRAVDECGAPSSPLPRRGEPLIHKGECRKSLPHRGAQEIRLSLHQTRFCSPSISMNISLRPILTFSIHLDGNRQRHDESVCQEGVFDKGGGGHPIGP